MCAILRFILDIVLSKFLLAVSFSITGSDFLMAGIATIGAVTGAVAATAGVVQAVSQAKPVFWDPLKVFLQRMQRIFVML